MLELSSTEKSQLAGCRRCKVTKVIYREQVTVFVKNIELNGKCFSIGYSKPPVEIGVVLFHATSPGGYSGHDLSTHKKRRAHPFKQNAFIDNSGYLRHKNSKWQR